VLHRRRRNRRHGQQRADQPHRAPHQQAAASRAEDLGTVPIRTWQHGSPVSVYRRAAAAAGWQTRRPPKTGDAHGVLPLLR
jgi:hypothetical protein